MAQLTLLLPERERLRGAPLPAALAATLARADRAQLEPGASAQLQRHVDNLPNPPPAAALTRLVDTDVDATRPFLWLRADPAYVRPDINGVRLLAIGDTLGVEQTDVDALLPALRPLFGDAGLLLDAPVPGRWYLQLQRGATLPSFAAPDEALGDDLFEHIPAGAEGRRWRSLLSETQVVLHNHPHNVWRQSVGKPPVNSLWFWGGGVLPHAVTWTAPTLYSDDPCLLGLALAGNIQGMPLDQRHGFDDDALVDVRALRDPHRIIGDWLQPALSAAAGKDVCLDFADGAVFRLAASQRWRFWRRPLASLAG